MMQVSVAGRYPSRSRFAGAPRRPYPPVASPRWPLAAIGVSALAHALVALGVVSLMMWSGWQPAKVYVVNLVPTVAAVGHPRAPAPSATVPTRAAPAPPPRVPAPAPTPAPREPAVREAPSLPAPSLARPSLPPRPLPSRAGEKELPPLASPSAARRLEKPDRIDKPVESRPGPVASLGLPTGSAAGVGALTLDVSDFPYAWYLRQVLQKVQGQWQRQNQINEPNQKPMVLVEIQRDGSIRTPKIDQSSGNALYDQAALRAIVEASPFPPLPSDWSRPALRVMFRFDLEHGRG
jgi:TonB family protein